MWIAPTRCSARGADGKRRASASCGPTTGAPATASAPCRTSRSATSSAVHIACHAKPRPKDRLNYLPRCCPNWKACDQCRPDPDRFRPSHQEVLHHRIGVSVSRGLAPLIFDSLTRQTSTPATRSVAHVGHGRGGRGEKKCPQVDGCCCRCDSSKSNQELAP